MSVRQYLKMREAELIGVSKRLEMQSGLHWERGDKDMSRALGAAERYNLAALLQVQEILNVIGEDQ